MWHQSPERTRFTSAVVLPAFITENETDNISLQAPNPPKQASIKNRSIYQTFRNTNKQVSLWARPEFNRKWSKVHKLAAAAMAVLTYPKRIQMQRMTGWHWRPDLSHCLPNCCSEKCWGTWGVGWTGVFLCHSDKKDRNKEKRQKQEN